MSLLRDSTTLARALEILDGVHVIVTDDSQSPWLCLDVDVRGRFVSFAIWKATDALYAEEHYPDCLNPLGPAMSEEPFDVERLAEIADG